MFQTHKTFIDINGTLFQVLKQIRASHAPVIDTWKEHLNADKVFKKDDFFFFVREVPEAEVVTEDTNTTAEPQKEQ